MALIEGVGDEVTLLFSALLVLVVLALAWASTSPTPEPPEHLFTPPPGSGHAPSTPPSGHASPDLPPSADDSSADPDSHVGDGSEAPPPADAATAPPPGEEVKEEDEGSVEREVGERGEPDGMRHREGGTEGSMVVRLKFLNDTERTAQVRPQDTVGFIKRTYFAGQEQQVRLIYAGQLLQDDGQTLSSLQLTHGCVLHCHVSPQGVAGGRGPATQGTNHGPAHNVQVAVNVGSLMVPVLVLMLSALWYCHIQYRHVFTAPATASLLGLTVFLSLLAFGVYRR